MPLLARIVFGAAGLALLVALVPAVASVRRFVASSVRVDGTVVALRAGGSHPTVEFTAPDGTAVRFPANGLIFGYRPGDRVQVRYDAADPGRSAVLDAAGSLWAWPMMLGTLGTGFTVAALTAGKGTA